MNIRDLKYLVAVAQLRHFGKAAEACFVSQPTLSGQLKKLEAELGLILFERSARSVVPTPAGERIIEQARRVLDEVEGIESLARTHGDPLAGPFEVGAIHTISPYLIPRVLAPLQAGYPQMHLVLHEDITANLVRRLLDHELDAIVLATPESHPDLVARPLYREPFRFAHALDHPFAAEPRITADHLEHDGLLLLADGHCLADQVLDVCRGPGGLRPGDRGDLRAASLETLIRLVGMGYGTTLIPALAVSEAALAELNVVARPIETDSAERLVSLVHRRSFPRPEALDAFVTALGEALPASVTAHCVRIDT